MPMQSGFGTGKCDPAPPTYPYEKQPSVPAHTEQSPGPAPAKANGEAYGKSGPAPFVQPKSTGC
jgi:hypothetical protein